MLDAGIRHVHAVQLEVGELRQPRQPGDSGIAHRRVVQHQRFEVHELADGIHRGVRDLRLRHAELLQPLKAGKLPDAGVAEPREVQMQFFERGQLRNCGKTFVAHVGAGQVEMLQLTE